MFKLFSDFDTQKSFKKNENFFWNLIFAAWLLALISTLGSLFFSEVMEFQPCSLCWYQRIMMYPLVIVLLTGLFPPDVKVLKFSLPLVVTGWLIAVYHNLLYYGVIPESASPCTAGVPCSTVYIQLFGFISIPLLSLMSFSILLVLLLSLYRRIYR